MSSYQDKTTKSKQKSVANRSKTESDAASVFQFKDNRPEAEAQLKLKEHIESSSRESKPIQKKGNNTGLPDKLKSGIESLSGHSMDDVKVHYNSSKPAQLNAHAYAQGTNIHLASGQEKHLPHEAWHVVQQKQGRVQPTKQLKQKVSINDDASLEKEADVMGAKAMQLKANSSTYTKKSTSSSSKETVQLFSYTRKEPLHGVTMKVKIQDTGSRLNVIDQTVPEEEQNIGQLTGYIGYEENKEEKEMVLDHFEAQPAGSGLGTLLMFELANLALSGGYKLISVNAPALSAMGAYKYFGGVPRNPEAHEAIKGMHLKAMEAEPERHADFVKTEAEEHAAAQVGKAKYFNPELESGAASEIYEDAKHTHQEAHSGVGDHERVADLRALSTQLTYDPLALYKRTLESVDARWTFK
ncbi:DUF4157 domain-containing protein [uncultured Kordia sp.]|uniref:eCIS core domain-containing protein n=1 Tax=uncultured Kordia sp. TaxID=507699 RepID=UPI0026354458|nr:DUF4157 domain-containing protein [uncultured Kordia sp.]